MTQSTESSSAPPVEGRKRWLLIALFASVGLNLLVIGIIVGAKVNGRPMHKAMASSSSFSVGRAIRQFPEDRRDELWPVARPHFSDLRSTLRALRKANRDFAAAYEADPVDLAELNQSHAILSKQINALQQMNFKALRALAESLTPTERKQLLSALRPPRGHRPKHRPDGAHPPSEAHQEKMQERRQARKQRMNSATDN